MKRRVQLTCGALVAITMCYKHLRADQSGAADPAKADMVTPLLDSTRERSLPRRVTGDVGLALGTERECRGRYSVVLPMIDAVRADTFWVGYEHDIAPRLTGLPPSCVGYTRAYALREQAAKSTSLAR
jgi:hypothetical protein